MFQLRTPTTRDPGFLNATYRDAMHANYSSEDQRDRTTNGLECYARSQTELSLPKPTPMPAQSLTIYMMLIYLLRNKDTIPGTRTAISRQVASEA